METEIHSNLIASEISKYHHILPHEYPLFQNYQLLGDSQFVRFSELFLNCKRQYHQNSSGRVGYCISGQTAQQLSHHLEQKFWPVYKNVILLIGTNDINNNTDPTQWKETIDKIVTCLSQLDVDNLIMLSVPPVPKLWHTILHWTLYVEYNDILKNIEGVYKNKFKFIRFLDITSIFFDKTAPSPSLYSSCLDLYVANPVREGCTSYDADFMMSGVPRQSSLESKRKDTSYLKQSISLFDAMNMRYKLMTCFFGQTNEQDVSINKERFDLIGVTLNDVRNIKSNLLAVYNEEYMFTLRHAFQKFIGHVREDQNAGKRGSRGSPEYSNPRKVLRTDLLAYTGDDLETCGVLCRSFDSSSDSKVPTATSQVSEQIPTDIFPTVNEKSQLGAKVPLKIKSEISLKRSSSPNASQPSKKRNSDNIWIELSSDNGNNTALGGNSSQSGNCGKFSQCSYSVTVSTNENSSEASRKVTSNLIPTTVVLKQRSREAIPELSSASTSTGSNEDAPMLPDDLKSCPTGALSKKVRGNHTRDETDYSDLCGKSVWKASSLERANNTEEADVLRIDYLTQDEKQDLDERFKKRERKVKDKRDRILDGYDKSFMARANTIQFYQYVQRVCRYQTNNDTTPLQEKAFAMHMRNMRSNKVSKLEAKFHMSMLGRYEFYKFIKYIALDFIVPKMFPGKYKKVMLTSVVDKERNVEKYIVRNLDVSVFETHYSRYPNSSSNKSPKIDLVHLNQQGFELLKDNLTEVITQMQREDSSP